MGSYQTTLCLVNFSGKKIKATRVTGVDNYDWDGDYRPDHNFAGALADGSSRCRRAELNSAANGAWFSLGVTFDDNSTIDFKVNQQDAYERLFRSYPQDDYDVRMGGWNPGLQVFQATGRDGNDQPDGATWTNALYIRPATKPDNSGWMGRLRNAKPGVKLNEMTMPGSHDAGMYVAGNDQADTQSLSIANQLAAGSRYFDIRVYDDGGTLKTYHGNTDGVPLGGILTSVATFIGAHRSETVFLKFRSYASGDQQPTIDLVKSKLGNWLLKPAGSTNIATSTLDSMKGKVVTVFRVGHDYPPSLMDPTHGIVPYLDYGDEDTGARISHPAGAGGLGVYDSYANVNDYESMSVDQWAKYRAYGGNGQDYLYLLSWTLTGKPALLFDLELLSRTANPHLPEQLHLMANHPRGLPNIVYLDYVDEWLCTSVIAMNGI